MRELRSFLVLGAEKHDAGPAYPSYSGWLDDLRLSGVLRYAASFTPPAVPFVPDASTRALYAFDEGAGDAVHDASGASGGPSHGERRFGGSPAGPEWSTLTPFPPPAADPGIVPDEATVPGLPLAVGKDGLVPGDLDLAWGASCETVATDYAVYEGQIGVWYSHVAAACSTGGATSVTLSPGIGDR